jgi:hypothetical protein
VVLGWLVKQQQEVDVTSPLTRRSRGSGKRGEGDWTRGFWRKAERPSSLEPKTRQNICRPASSPPSSWDRIPNTHAPALCDVAASRRMGTGRAIPPPWVHGPMAGLSHPATSLRRTLRNVFARLREPDPADLHHGTAPAF